MGTIRSLRWLLWKLARKTDGFAYPIPDKRTCFIPEEIRISPVVAQLRFCAIDEENRTTTIPAGPNRITIVPVRS